MKFTLTPDEVHAYCQELAQSNGEFKSHYPADSFERQPVHTVYGGANLFKAGFASKLGEVALKTLDTYAPSYSVFARALIGSRLAALGRAESVPSPSYTLVQTYDLGDVELVDAHVIGARGRGGDEAHAAAREQRAVDEPERRGGVRALARMEVGRERLLAWALANDMAHADGFSSSDEQRYLSSVASIFELRPEEMEPFLADAREHAVIRETPMRPPAIAH